MEKDTVSYLIYGKYSNDWGFKLCINVMIAIYLHAIDVGARVYSFLEINLWSGVFCFF